MEGSTVVGGERLRGTEESTAAKSGRCATVKVKHCTKGAMKVKAPELRGGDVLIVTSR